MTIHVHTQVSPTQVRAADSARRTRVRLFIVLMLFLVTTINYADRATLSIAGTALSKELQLDPVALGYVFSAFSWSYVAAQIPGGWLLDRFGSKWVYAFSIVIWSAFTFMQGWIGFFTGASAIAVLFALRFLVGLAEAPSFPANARIVAAWFPGSERGTASAFFNSGQYFATVLFSPLMGWIAHDFGWRYVFFAMGGLGLAMGAIWIMTIHGPKDHPGVNAAEFDYIKEGGALVDMDAGQGASDRPKWSYVRQLLGNRMLLGVYLGQYCINALTYFFLTWFPVYLVKERGLTILQAGFVATLPALCGFFGGVLGGYISDLILRRTGSLTIARKSPIVVGMLLSMSIIGCNYSMARLSSSASWRWRSSARGLARLAGPSCPIPRPRRPVACRAGCSIPSAVWRASPRRSWSATSSALPAPSMERCCSSAPMRWSRRWPISSSSAGSNGSSSTRERLCHRAGEAPLPASLPDRPWWIEWRATACWSRPVAGSPSLRSALHTALVSPMDPQPVTSIAARSM